MPQSLTTGHDTHRLTNASTTHQAADIAGAAVLLNVAERIGLLPPLMDGVRIVPRELADKLNVRSEALSEYLGALLSAKLVESDGAGAFRASDAFLPMLHEVGYVSWTLNANRPFIDHAADFFRSQTDTRRAVHRDGYQVAITSQWMGAADFYPAARSAILERRPRRFVDLGAGSARLVIDVLLTLPDATGVAIDISAEACDAASEAAHRAGVADRLEVVERSIESVATSPEVLDHADAIHGGFVFHDMLPHDEDTFDRVLQNCAAALSQTGGTMLVTDAAPYVDNDRERIFSAAVSFLHFFFMGRQLLSEEEWKNKFRQNGFDRVGCEVLPFPTGRLYTASARG